MLYEYYSVLARSHRASREDQQDCGQAIGAANLVMARRVPH